MSNAYRFRCMLHNIAFGAEALSTGAQPPIPSLVELCRLMECPICMREKYLEAAHTLEKVTEQRDTLLSAINIKKSALRKEL